VGLKRPGFEVDHSPPSSAKVKNVWSCTPLPQHVFMARCLLKYRIRLHGMVVKYRDTSTSLLSDAESLSKS